MRVIKVINNRVTETKDVLSGYVLGENEIQSDTGEQGQIMQPDGTFITPEPESIETQPTLEERIESVKQDNLIIMDAMATIFEEILNLQAMQGGTV